MHQVVKPIYNRQCIELMQHCVASRAFLHNYQVYSSRPKRTSYPNIYLPPRAWHLYDGCGYDGEALDKGRHPVGWLHPHMG